MAVATIEPGVTARELLAENTDIRYVWRHLPLHDVHPPAEAAEAVAGTPTFFINERRHDGPEDLAALTKAIGEARAQADAFAAATRHDSGREEGPDGDAPIRSGSIPVSHGAVSPAFGPVPAIYVPSPKDPR